MFRPVLSLVLLVVAASAASAQSLGTLSWQLQPYCNVVSVTVTGVAGVYTLEGFDDQCGAATRAPLTGVATPNPDGTVGFGMNLVTSPGGRGVQVEARISIATLSGPWTDSVGNKGTFAFGANTGGSPRPLPVGTPAIPPVFGLRADGGFVAGGSVGAGAIPASGPGTRMMWHPNKHAFRSGVVSGTQWDDAQVGAGSIGFGLNTIASNTASFAHGQYSSATGQFATAIGVRALAAGQPSLAVGSDATASGDGSTALGIRAEATGIGAVAAGLDSAAGGHGAIAIGDDVRAMANAAVAFGSNTRANGAGSVALGRNVSVGGADALGAGTLLDVAGEGSIGLGYNLGTTVAGRGSFLFGDRSGSASFLQSFAPNQFLVRAAGGTKFFTNPSLNSGVMLAPSASAWSSVSDVNSKEHFRDLDGDDVLAKLARMPIREWNYKAQDAAIRHVGPTAQDFHAAFGLGEDPLRISTIDADGIALAGVSALARRNAALEADVAALRAELAAVRDLMAAAALRQ